MFNFHSTFNCNFILSFGDSVLFNFLTLPENRFPEITVWILTLDFEVSLYRTSDVKFHLRVIFAPNQFQLWMYSVRKHSASLVENPECDRKAREIWWSISLRKKSGRDFDPDCVHLLISTFRSFSLFLVCLVVIFISRDFLDNNLSYVYIFWVIYSFLSFPLYYF